MCNVPEEPVVSIFIVDEPTLMREAAGYSETVLLFY
jgi:hypothetical protein